MSKGTASQTRVNSARSCSAWPDEVGVVEEIEGLCAKLKVGSFAEPEVLQQAKVNPLGTWAEEASNGTTAEVALSRCEGASGKPLGSSFGEMNGRDLIRPRHNICIRADHSQATGISSRRVFGCA